MKYSKDYLLNVLAQGGSRALAMSSSFIVFIMIARVLGAEQVGNYALVMAFIMVAGNFAEFGITAALSKELPPIRDRSKEEAAVYFGNYLLLRAFLAVFVLVAALGVIWIFEPEQVEPMLIGSFAIPFIGARFTETIFQIYHRPIYTLYSSAWLAISQLIVAGVLLLYFEVGVTGFIYGYVVTQFLYFWLCIYFAAKLVPPRFTIQKPILAGIAAIGVPVGFWTMFNIVSTKADVFMLSYLRSSEELGIYNVAYRLLDLGTAVAVTAATPLIPVIVRHFKADAQAAKQECVAILELSFALLLIVPILLPHLAPFIVLTLFGEEYASSVPLVSVFAWVFFLIATMYIGMSINLALGDLRYSWWSGLIAAITNVLLNALLIPQLGVMGAAFSAMASNAVMLVITLYFVWQNIGQFVSISKLLKIMLAAAGTLLLLQFVGSEQAVYFTPVALIIYLIALWMWGLVPRHLPNLLRNSKQRKRGD